MTRTATARILPTIVPEANGSQLRAVSKDEKFSPAVRTLEAGLVEATFAVRSDKNSETRYEVRTTFDFRGVQPSDVQKLAIKHCVIEMQRRFRTTAESDLAGALKSDQWGKCNVQSAIVEAGRAKVDPIARAKSAIAKSGMTKEQILALAASM